MLSLHPALSEYHNLRLGSKSLFRVHQEPLLPANLALQSRDEHEWEAEVELLSKEEEQEIKLMRLGQNQSVIARRLRVSREHFNRWLNGKQHSARLEKKFEALSMIQQSK